MPLNILLADDSVPAQNMGKKILMDAGYGVVTVSNGLEALRKIGDAVPDMAILDIFMPGYTGLEICKHLRASAATAAVPVILTVGKLEPYRPEDGEQVQSNAVIVKPFAASELISAVRSLIGSPVAESQTGAGPEATAQAKSQPVPASNSLTTDPATLEPDAPASVVDGDGDLFYSGEFLLSATERADRDDAAILSFDPDAKHTPFSASAIESLSTTSPAAAENGASEFGNFDLEIEPSAYSAPEAVMPRVEDPSLPCSSGDEVAVHEVAAGAAQPPSAPEPLASASLAGCELESSGPDSTVLDPLVELPEAFGSSGVSLSGESLSGESGANILDREAAEQDSSEFGLAGAATEEDEAENAVQLSPEEEARREAFEALFNSPEPLPLDHIAVPHSEVTLSALGSSAAALVDDATDLATSSAIPFATPIEAHYEVHSEQLGADPNPLEEAPLASELEAGSAWKPEEMVAATANGIDAPQFEPETSQQIAEEPAGIATASPEEAATTEAAPIEVQQVCTEADLETPAAYEPVISAEPLSAVEVLQAVPVPELAKEASQAGCEDAPLESVPYEIGTVPSEAVQSDALQPGAEAPEPVTEIFGYAVDSPLEDAGCQIREPHFEQPMADMGHPAEVAPLVSADVAEEPLEPTRIESEPEQQPEASMTAISSSPGVSSRLNEAERIHRAIELVFDRFKPLLVAAIVRELARSD